MIISYLEWLTTPPLHFDTHELEKILSADLLACDRLAYEFCWILSISGLRVGEALTLRWSDIDFENGVLKVSTLRRKAFIRNIPIQHTALNKLSQMFKDAKTDISNRVFEFSRKTAYNYVRKACQMAGIKDGRAMPTTFRYTFAITCARHGVPIPTLHLWMGHRDIKNTCRYYAGNPSGATKSLIEKVVLIPDPT